MTVAFACQCGKQFEAADEYAGKKVKCEACGTVFVVPVPNRSKDPARQVSPAAPPPPPPRNSAACPLCHGEIAPTAKKCRHCGEWLDLAHRMSATGTAYASFGARVAAFFIDGFLLVIACAPIVITFELLAQAGELSPRETNDMIPEVTNLLLFFGGWLYYAIMESSRYQATLGKLLLKVEVVHESGERLSFGRASGRYWAKLVSLMSYIGFFMPLFTRKRQALHDMIAQCIVVPRAKESTVAQSTTQDPAAHGTSLPEYVSKPIGVSRAVLLLYLSLAVGIVRGVLGISGIVSAPLGDLPQEVPIIVVSTIIVVGNIIGLAGISFLFHMIGRGRNWARITLLVIAIPGAPIQMVVELQASMIWSLSGAVILILQVTALVLLFQKPSNRWFTYMKASRTV